LRATVYCVYDPFSGFLAIRRDNTIISTGAGCAQAICMQATKFAAIAWKRCESDHA